MLALAGAVGLSASDELPEIETMLGGALAGEMPDHLWFVDDDGIAGLAHVAPEAFADGVWNLYLLAVDPARQGGGRGAALVRHVEDTARARGDDKVVLHRRSPTAPDAAAVRPSRARLGRCRRFRPPLPAAPRPGRASTTPPSARRGWPSR